PARRASACRRNDGPVMSSVRSLRSATLPSRTLAVYARDYTNGGCVARPRTAYLIATMGTKKKQQYIIGVDLGGTNIVVGALSADGKQHFAMRSIPTSPESGAEGVADRI